ncbi:energy transducer TonB [Pseudomonas mangiferae]|uniref:energy transducer TonB n=1 Tax=Pseudomonas mangiferae TaxID=2593654 RepID=UPI0015B6087B|nr:energy transducer TonB [Pseudomonas mangiferae]
MASRSTAHAPSKPTRLPPPRRESAAVSGHAVAARRSVARPPSTPAASRPLSAPAASVVDRHPVAEPTPDSDSSALALASRPPVEVFSRKPGFLQPPAPPRYPSQARRRNQQGVVLVEVRLDVRGQQRGLTVLRSSGVGSLDAAALEAVAGWRFRPETVEGQPVPSRVHIPVEFALTANR